jgi:hypothetical protein
MKHISRDENDVRRNFDHSIDGTIECHRDIPLALVDPGGRQSLKPTEPEMQVSHVDQAHGQI